MPQLRDQHGRHPSPRAGHLLLPELPGIAKSRLLIFVDISGDPGRKILRDSSRFLIVALVAVEELTAHDCAERIQRLRTELGLPEDYGFHFSQNSVSIRDAFLRALSPYPFSCYMSASDKGSRGLDTLGIRRNEDLSRFLIRQTFESALWIL